MSFPPQGSGSGSGGSGGDSNFLGWFNDSTELTTQYPTTTAGKYAKIVDTETIWVWDTDTYIWTDSGLPAYSDGDVTGPASATIGDIPYFSTADGKTIADSNISYTEIVTGPPTSTLGNFLAFAANIGNAVYDSGISSANLVTEYSELTDVNLSGLADGDIPQYDSTTSKWLNTQLDYGDVHAPGGGVTSTSIAKFSGTSGQQIVGTDILINSSNNINLQQHTIFNGTIDGGDLDV